MVGEDISECPICGTKVKEGSKECPLCGEKLIEERGQEEVLAELTKISDIDLKRAKKLYDEGIRSLDDVIKGGIVTLIDLEGIGIDSAIDIVDEVKELKEEKEMKEEKEVVETITRDLEELTTFSEDELEEEKILDDLLGKESDSSSPERSEVIKTEKQIEKNNKEDEGIVAGFLKNIDSMKGLWSDEEEEKKIRRKKRSKVAKKKEEKHKEVPGLTVEKTELYKNLPEAIPAITAIFIPILLLIYVGLEFIIALLAYPSIYPARSIYYLTPSPFLQPSWISSLTLSFLVTVGLFLPTWRGYDFSSESGLKLQRYMISISVVFSVIIAVSLILHIYHSFPDPVGLLTFLLLFLTLFLLVVQFDLIFRGKTEFPETAIRKLCPECGEKMFLTTENCPNCGLKVAVPKQGLIDKEESDKEDRTHEEEKKTDKDDEEGMVDDEPGVVEEDLNDESKLVVDELEEDDFDEELDEDPGVVEEKLTEEEDEEDSTEDEEDQTVVDEPRVVEEKLNEKD